jgi:CheY-like chemotaxis protein
MEAMLARVDGLRVVTAPLPGLGLQMAHDERPDLILLDIQLPGMDGYEVLRRLRADPLSRAVPVIAVSANAMPSDVDRGIAAGFADYLTKPLDMNRLIASVEAVLLAARSTA